MSASSTRIRPEQVRQGPDDNGAALVQERIQQLLARFPDPSEADPAEFLGAQYDVGLAWVHFMPDFGGLGVAAGLQVEIDLKLRAVAAPVSRGDYIALNQAAEAIHAAGSAEQKTRFLRPIFAGTEHWCQLFSEPGAGSDLAGLSTTAERDDEEWIVNGQKVWTSGAQEAQWAILVARTNPDLPKHRGLTFFVCDMRAQGVEIRPLRQADGNSRFNEVFLTNVRVPDSMRIGDVGEGWRISLTGLHSERDSASDAFASPIGLLLDAWKQYGGPTATCYRVRRDQVVRVWIESKVVELCVMRMRAALGRGGATPLGSLLKLASSQHAQRLSETLLDVMGLAGQVGFDYDAPPQSDSNLHIPRSRMLAVRSRAMSIEGGTSEIQRNIIGERVLGLPGEPRFDKDVPWRDVPRSARDH